MLASLQVHAGEGVLAPLIKWLRPPACYEVESWCCWRLWLFARPTNRLRWGVMQMSRTGVRGQMKVCPYSLPHNWLRQSPAYLCRVELTHKSLQTLTPCTPP